MNLRGKKVLFIIAQKDFRDEELIEPKKVLEAVEADITIASKTTEPAEGMLGSMVVPNISLDKIDPRDYDAIVFVGGTGAESYFNDTRALNIAKLAYASGKVVGAICIAPAILANAGILKERKATCFPSEAETLKQKGATYTGKDVEQDGKIITASGPKAGKEFGEKIFEELAR